MQVPSNIFLNKIGKPALYLPTAMVIWGVISALTGATQNFAGLLVCRLFLGIIEAAFFPGWSLSCFVLCGAPVTPWSLAEIDERQY